MVSSFKTKLKHQFYNDLFFNLKKYVRYNSKEINISKTNIEDIRHLDIDDFDIQYIVTTKKTSQGLYSILKVVCFLEVKEYGRYGYEIDNGETWLNVHIIYKLDGGIKDFNIIKVEDADTKIEFKSEYTDNFVPIISSNTLEIVAEQILSIYQPTMLETPRALDVKKLLSLLDVELIERKLSKDNSILGEIVFKDMKINIFEESDKPSAIDVSKGTIIVDPTIKDLRNLGSYNNTVVHELVHWILHRNYQECRMIVDSNANTSFIDANPEFTALRWTDIEWMEWHANSIAPRLLMPKKTTKQKVNELFTEYSLKYSEDLKTNMFEQVIDDIADFFQVSRLAAKIRLQQLGYKEFEGIYNFVGNQYLRSYSFELKALASNQTFTISFPNACLLNWKNERFREIMDTNQYVYVDSHFCLNNSKYVNMIEFGIYEMTDYAYEHMDECCLVFDIFYKSDRKKDISITTFNDYIMYRGKTAVEIEIDFSDYLTIVNGTIEIQNGEIFKELAKIKEKLPGTFPKTLVFHRMRKKLTQENLEELSYISVATIRRLETTHEAKRSIETMMALSLGMKLYPDLSFDLINKSGTSFRDEIPTHSAYKMVLRSFYHLGTDKCNDWLIEMGIPGFLKK